MSETKAPLTVGKLREMLKHSSANTIIKTEANEDFVHVLCGDDVILSTSKPIGICNRSGGYVYPTTTPDYAGYCPKLDEDLYSFEFTKN